MDGTLVDSERCAAQAISDVIGHVDITPAYIDQHYKGWKLVEIFRQIGMTHKIDFDNDVIDRYRAREDELSVSMVTENPGVRQTLSRLNCHTCIASNAPKEKTRRSLTQCNLQHFFDERIYSAYDIQKWKPDPSLFLHAAEAEGHAVANCLVVEDSMAGLEAALAAKMTAVFYNPRKEAHSLSNVHTLQHFEELLDLVLTGPLGCC